MQKKITVMDAARASHERINLANEADRSLGMSCNKSNCVIALGLTIMDRCPECEKIANAAQEEERIARNAAFASKSSRDYNEMGRVSSNKRPPHAQSTEATDPPAVGEDIDDSDAVFFITCIEDEGEHRRLMLLGPYDTHAEALRNVDHGRKLAEQDPKAHWYYFGTCSMAKETETKGVFGK